MADWTTTGYERSMKIAVTKTGDNTPPSVYIINLDGQAAFTGSGAVDDITFGRYTDIEFNNRVTAYTEYLRTVYDVGGTNPEPGLVDSIQWSNARRLKTVPVPVPVNVQVYTPFAGSIMAKIPTNTVGYGSNALETLTITVNTSPTATTPTITLIIANGTGASSPHSLTADEGLTTSIQSATIVPVNGIYGNYSVGIIA